MISPENNKPHPPGTRYLILLTFVSGMTIMGLEMCSGRLMAPFFGTSVMIWTVIIGSTMIALTAGYYLGGLLAEKKPKVEFLAAILFFAASFVIFLPYVAQPVMEIALGRFSVAADSSSNALVTALSICALLISAPAVILGMTSPFIIHVAALDSSGVGRTAGKVFAFSTLGSILGTLMPALILLPWIGMRLSFLFFGGLLLCTVLWPLRRSGFFYFAAGTGIVIVALLLGLNGLKAPLKPPLVHQRETLYQHVSIFQIPISSQKEDARATVLLTDAGIGMQSMWIEGSPITDSWQDMFALVPRVYYAANRKFPDKMLLIGLGGACAPYLISQQYPDTVIDGVEIDRGLLEAAAPYFPFSYSPRLVSHVSDGRLFMRASRGQYDIVLVDAFRPPHIPFHLASLEFFAEVKQRMTGNGLLAMNIGTTGDKLVFRDIANTVAAVFPHVYYAEYRPTEGGSVFTTRLLIASENDAKVNRPEVESEILDFPDQTWNKLFQVMRDSQRSAEGSETSFFKKIPYDSAGTVFTDDLSALEIVSEKEFMPLTLGYKSGVKK
ncbi:spermidine synthase [Desulfomonile tiedjei]|uniref:PABS domain-containing protein n=1 Tax=Desulfomonile tiedjei (strain ATCC 49306 / DSM 6799 / DCB-1) TaxID=706587 RepID=I4C064_DESTA|nr:fused MFS/spermidine synthase [Desulfomonile tiedjei]AFM22955.1 hypothetical protein Desti_0209 [Desulfomonile tiedjei DSM 6799]